MHNILVITIHKMTAAFHVHLYTSYRLTSRSTITEFAETLYKRRRLFFNLTLRSLAPTICKHFYITLFFYKRLVKPPLHKRRQKLILSSPVFSGNFIKRLYINSHHSAVSYCYQALTYKHPYIKLVESYKLETRSKASNKNGGSYYFIRQNQLFHRKFL